MNEPDNTEKEIEEIFYQLDDQGRRDLYNLVKTARKLPPQLRSIYLKSMKWREQARWLIRWLAGAA